MRIGNAVSPGVIQTQMHPPESYQSGQGERLPLIGHVGHVSDVVVGVLFLESSPYITGEVVHIDGGKIAEAGAYAELERPGTQFADLLAAAA